MEAQKVLKFEENYSWASCTSAWIYIYQGKWQEALEVAEKGYPLIPNLCGLLAGILKHMGDPVRSEEYIHKLMPSSSYGSPAGLANYHIVLGEMDKAADWLEKAIGQRHPLVYISLQLIRSSPRWPAVAKLMNLSEELGGQAT